MPLGVAIIFTVLIAGAAAGRHPPQARLEASANKYLIVVLGDQSVPVDPVMVPEARVEAMALANMLRRQLPSTTFDIEPIAPENTGRYPCGPYRPCDELQVYRTYVGRAYEFSIRLYYRDTLRGPRGSDRVPAAEIKRRCIVSKDRWASCRDAVMVAMKDVLMRNEAM